MYDSPPESLSKASLKNMRIAVWVQGVPSLEGASPVLYWHYIDGLLRAGAHILVVLLSISESAAEEAQAYAAHVRARGADAIVCMGTVEPARHGLRIVLDASPMRSAIAASNHFSPDTSLCLDVTAAWVATHSARGAGVVWLGDLRFQTGWHHARIALRERPVRALALPKVTLHLRAWREAYRVVLAQAHRVVVSSHSSVAVLKRMGIPSAYLPYPWPAPPEPREHPAPPPLPTFAFFGTLDALGSRAGLHFLIDDLLPRLRRQWGQGGFRLIVAGRGTLPSWAAEAFGAAPEVSVMGFVEDLVALMRGTHGVIVPIDVPVGNRSRIVTAMAAGSLVIAHPFVALANPELIDLHTCHLAPDAEGFAERMRRAVEDPVETASIIARAQQSYRATFDPAVAVPAFLEVVLASAHGPAGSDTPTEPR